MTTRFIRDVSINSYNKQTREILCGYDTKVSRVRLVVRSNYLNHSVTKVSSLMVLVSQEVHEYETLKL